MLEGHQLASLGKVGKRLAFPAGLVALDKSMTVGRQDEKSAIDQTAIAPRLLDEARHPISVERSSAP